MYQTPPIGAFKEHEETTRAWAEKNGAALRSALKLGIAETMKMLALDLGANAARPVTTATPKLSFAEASALVSYPSYLVKDGNRYIVRVDGGALLSASSENTFGAEASAGR